MSFAKAMFGGLTALSAAMAAACGPAAERAVVAPAPTATDALAFLAGVDEQYTAIGEEAARIGWVNATYINFDTDWLAANIDARTTELAVRFAKEAVKYDDVGSSRVDLQACKLEYSIVSPK